MIKLFVTDLDGCISYPFKTPKWDAINKIRELNIKSRDLSYIPPLTICTGRPHPYAEAVAQWLDVRLPFVFESAGLYHWNGNRVETALGSNNGALDTIREMRKWMEKDVLPEYPAANFEFSKMMDAGIVCPDKSVIDKIYEKVVQKIQTEFDDLEIHATDVSVNVLVKGNNKLQGMKLLASSQNIALNEIAYIGDTSGDLPALKNVRLAYSPINGRDVVKQHSTVLKTEITDAVLEAYQKVILHNKNLAV